MAQRVGDGDGSSPSGDHASHHSHGHSTNEKHYLGRRVATGVGPLVSEWVNPEALADETRKQFSSEDTCYLPREMHGQIRSGPV